ncbi:4-hydroxybenzoate decarboxylase subunit C [Escherichia coli]|nr:4-hydroxybenzoate decarboxylase subunit C [Escherichia coli]
MAFDDLRSFLQALDDHGQLLKISEEVNAEPDLAAAANATGRIGDGAPALWFDNIRGFTDARVAMNTIGSWQNHAISLGLPPNTPVKSRLMSLSAAGRTSRLPQSAAPIQPGRRTPSMAKRSTCSIFCRCFV